MAQGLFERHKLLMATQLCMKILQKRGEGDQQHGLSYHKYEYLMRGPKASGRATAGAVHGRMEPVARCLLHACGRSCLMGLGLCA